MSDPSVLEAEDLDVPWWAERTAKKALPKLTRIFQHYAMNSQERLDAYTGMASLYTNRDLHSNGVAKRYIQTMAPTLAEYSRVPLNVIKVLVDAVHARLTRPSIAVEFLCAGANQSLRRRARQNTQFIQYMFHKTDVRPQTSQIVSDALIYNLGIMKTSPHSKVDKVTNERVHPRDIFVDEIEVSATGSPTHMYQRMFVSRSRLKALFPKCKKAIDEAGRLTDITKAQDLGQRSTTIDTTYYNLVEVVEAWKLPSWEEADDGRHAIFIDGDVLEFGEWECADFPFSFLRWKHDPNRSFYGISLAEELLGLHFDINTSILHTEKAIEANPKPYILVPTDGEVEEGSIGNIWGVILKHTGRPPQIIMPKSVPMDVVQYIDVQWNRALQVARLSALGLPESAGGQAQTGQAFKDIVDIQSTELAPAFQELQDYLVRLAEQNLVAGKLLDYRLREEEGRKYKVILRKDRNTVEEIEWDLIAMDPKDDSYVVQASPTSGLSATFGARLAEVKELLNMGLLMPSRAFKMLDIPDLDSEMRLQNASLDFTERVMEDILDEGVYTEPEATMDLRLALKTCQMYINIAKSMKIDDSRVTMLYQFLDQVGNLIEEQQEATQMQAAGMSPGFAGGPPAMDITGMPPGAAPMQQPPQQGM
jgi:hypothetical protein